MLFKELRSVSYRDAPAPGIATLVSTITSFRRSPLFTLSRVGESESVSRIESVFRVELTRHGQNFRTHGNPPALNPE